ncbi:MAG: metallophosphoesterase [Clostridiales bacterium]|nr:metallophosphoesterase [Clostridiales bacterium]
MKKDIKLKFKNGKFRIFALSDTHVVANGDARVTRDIDAIVEAIKPDLVLYLGDQVWKSAAENADTLRDALHMQTDPVEKRGIPWAHVFGNHDRERGFKNEDQEKIYEEFPHCLSEAGPDEIDGTGNYMLPVFDGEGKKIVYAVWAVDSHSGFMDLVKKQGLNEDPWFYSLPEPLTGGVHSPGYDMPHFSQVLWYWNKSLELEREQGGKVPGLMVMHQPMPEYTIPYKNPAQTFYRGNMRESVGTGNFNSGLFGAVVERGDVKTIISGHDHINDWQAQYLGVTLSYDAGLSYDNYCDDDLRGGRVVDIDENDPWNVKTYMVRSSDFVPDYPGEKKEVIKC